MEMNEKMKRFTLVLMMMALLMTGCSAGVTSDEKVLFSWGGSETFSDDGAFHQRNSTISGGNVICYYSNDSGISIPLCNKPDCTHNITTSPDCNALANQPKGTFTADGSLYFMELDKDTDDMNLICADINGGNRRTVASIPHGAMSAGFIERIRFSDGKLFYTTYDSIDTELLDTANEIKVLDKYIASVRSIDVSNGEIKVLVKRQDYNARISNIAIMDNTLIYLYSYFTAPSSSADGYTDEEWNEFYRYGVYAVDLNTGDEKCLTDGYDRMALAGSCFDDFSYDRAVFYSTDTNKLYRYSEDVDTFTSFAECVNINNWFISNNKYALFLEKPDDESFKRYNFETGETTEISRDGFVPVYLNGTITGDKVWFGYTDGNDAYCRGYMDCKDLMNGNYDGFKFAYYVNEEG